MGSLSATGSSRTGQVGKVLPDVPATVSDELGARTVGALIRSHEECEPGDIDGFAAARDRLVLVEEVDVLGARGVPHHRIDASGMQRGDPYIVSAELDGGDFRQAPDRPFAARVGDQAVLGLETVDGGYVDDGPAAGISHGVEDGTHAQKCTHLVDANDAVVVQRR